MLYDIIKMLNEQYGEVVCPACGYKVKWIITGSDSYETQTCGHPQMRKRLEEREKLLLETLRECNE